MKLKNINFNPLYLTNKNVEVITLEKLYKYSLSSNSILTTPHRISFNVLIYIKEGEGKHFIDFKRWTFRSGELIFVSKNQVHAFDFSSKVEGVVVLYTENFVENIQSNMRSGILSFSHYNNTLSPIFSPSKILIQSCDAVLKEISNEIKLRKCMDLVLMHLLSSLFLMIGRDREQVSSALNNSQNEIFKRFIHLLEYQTVKSRNALIFANKLGVSYKTLNKLSKLALNKTAKQVIDDYIVIESKRMLLLGEGQIQEIASKAGFEDVSNFVKYFKKKTLQTPSQFQKTKKVRD